jgi:4-amino-4-deoxychorismate lyase
LPEGIHEWVFLNECGDVCEGTITNVVVTTPNGDRLTPPLASGCLPGVFRQSLLAEGTVNEVVLNLEDLREAKSITLVNALRGLLNARWDETSGPT